LDDADKEERVELDEWRLLLAFKNLDGFGFELSLLDSLRMTLLKLGEKRGAEANKGDIGELIKLVFIFRLFDLLSCSLMFSLINSCFVFLVLVAVVLLVESSSCFSFIKLLLVLLLLLLLLLLFSSDVVLSSKIFNKLLLFSSLEVLECVDSDASFGFVSSSSLFNKNEI
jgi:hypothetical protein